MNKHEQGCKNYVPLPFSFYCANCGQIGSNHQCVWDRMKKMFERAGATK